MVILNCSPKVSKGVSNEVIGGLQDYCHNNGIFESTLSLRHLEISPCIDCGYCERNKCCFMNDDMQSLYKIFDEEELFVVVTPIFFDNPTPYFVSMLSRMNAVFKSKRVLNDSMIDKSKKRTVLPILIGGSRDYGQFDKVSHIVRFFSRTINAEYMQPIIIHSTDTIEHNLENTMKEIESRLKRW